MKNKKFYRLWFKLLLAIVIWSLCILSFVASTVVITYRMENHGMAINKAGALGTKIFRMAAVSALAQSQEEINHQADDFLRILSEIEDLNTLFLFQDKQTNFYAQNVVHLRRQFLSFQQSVLLAQEKKLAPEALLVQARHLSNELGHFVQLIENDNTKNIDLLRKMRIALITILIFSAFVSFYLLHRFVLYPLKTITHGMERIAQGHWDTRTHVLSNDEFRLLSDGFNSMAQQLEKTYIHLENKVSEKTSQLNQTHHNWEMLYEMTAYLHQKSAQEGVIADFIQRLPLLINTQAVCVHLLTERKILALCNAYQMPDYALDFIENAVDDWAKIREEKTIGIDENKLLSCYPIFYGNDFLGFISLLLNENLSDMNHLLMKSLSVQLGVTVRNRQGLVKEKQLAILEERNLMAQGLHDSIAQSLSFLGLQVQMLEQAYAKNQLNQAVQNIDFIREGVKSCYSDVRELLSNFKMSPICDNFIHSLELLVRRYSVQMEIVIDLQLDSDEFFLEDEAQLQIIFILQEVLSNIRKHAQASEVSIHLSQKENFVLCVTDNGVGFDINQAKNDDKHAHFGLQIIHERAQKIGAHLDIQSVCNQYTKVILTLAQRIKD